MLSAHELLIVFGWFGSGPLPSRPFTSAPESQPLATPEHRGAFNPGSKTAVATTGLLTVTVTVPLVPTLLTAS